MDASWLFQNFNRNLATSISADMQTRFETAIAENSP